MKDKKNVGQEARDKRKELNNTEKVSSTKGNLGKTHGPGDKEGKYDKAKKRIKSE